MNAPANSIRDGQGRFLRGSACAGPGRPRAFAEARYAAAFRSACPPKVVQELVAILVEKARRGDVQAAKVLLDRCCPAPKPVEAPAEAGRVITVLNVTPAELEVRSMQARASLEAERQSQR